MIQIFGAKKCKDSAKAVRFFKERNIKFHFVDLAEKGISKGELQNISKVISLPDLIDTDSKEYERLNLKYMKFDIEEELLSHPLLLKTPIVRSGKKVSCGFDPQLWKEIALLNNS
ncbi:MAG: arsenate reductase family protein [Spirochaetes bacterium]|nr:arsenate reductase family protein [Spirochaetota bacterium]